LKERLDKILVKRGLAPSREAAKALIEAGQVTVNGRTVKKAGGGFEEQGIPLDIQAGTVKYVSRGGLKLAEAAERFGIAPAGKICVDIGASAGGFTDYLLQSGAAKVYSIDVGHGQLAGKLRDDPRVVCMEKTNFRYLEKGALEDEPQFAGADVSFISLTKILIPAWRLLHAQGQMVCLVKPQFEAGKGKVGKKGVVKSRAVQEEALHKILDFADSVGFAIRNLCPSPVKGAEGNLEYLLHLEKKPDFSLEWNEQEAEGKLEGLRLEKTGFSRNEDWNRRIRAAVAAAHHAFGKKPPAPGSSDMECMSAKADRGYRDETFSDLCQSAQGSGAGAERPYP
jgi:23S rRNA (cytidine1920-2'-O)/16S rRNA (cytidine1409-2'-O)-methyltransferase